MVAFSKTERGQPLLSVVDLCSGYADTEVLRGVSLNVATGDFVGVLGPNGAGKTTLLKALTRLIPTQSGSVSFSGLNLLSFSTHHLARIGIAIVPEGKQLWPDLTIGEHLVTAGENSRKDRAVRDRQMELAFSLFPLLRERYAARVNTLSGGQQQMVAVGRALMSSPRLLLLDEPSVGLAPKVTLAMFEAISALRSSNLTVVLVEQNIAAALSVVDRAYLFRDGRVIESGSVEEIRAMDLRRIFLH